MSDLFLFNVSYKGYDGVAQGRSSPRFSFAHVVLGMPYCPPFHALLSGCSRQEIGGRWTEWTDHGGRDRCVLVRRPTRLTGCKCGGFCYERQDITDRSVLKVPCDGPKWSGLR